MSNAVHDQPFDIFELQGHDNPAGFYPAFVVPIGEVKGALWVSYRSSKSGRVDFAEISEETKFVRHDGQLKERLERFNYRTDDLFAFSREDVVGVSEVGRIRFLQDLLRRREASYIPPFYRLSLAVEARDPFALHSALARCILDMQQRAPEFIAGWKVQFEEELRGEDYMMQGLVEVAASHRGPRKGEYARVRNFLGLNSASLSPHSRSDWANRRLGTPRFEFQRFLSDLLPAFLDDLRSVERSGLTEEVDLAIQFAISEVSSQLYGSEDPALELTKMLMQSFANGYRSWSSQVRRRSSEISWPLSYYLRGLVDTRKAMVRSVRRVSFLPETTHSLIASLILPFLRLSRTAPEVFPSLLAAVKRSHVSGSDSELQELESERLERGRDRVAAAVASRPHIGRLPRSQQVELIQWLERNVIQMPDQKLWRFFFTFDRLFGNFGSLAFRSSSVSLIPILEEMLKDLD